MISDSTLKLTLKELSFVAFSCRVKENPQLLERAIEIILPL